jgi:integrative and conjugative element protein (TIGR02256 family)
MRRQVAGAEFCDSRHTVMIRQSATEILRKHEQGGKLREFGGILLGYVHKEYVEVVEVTVPNQLDSSGPGFFVRSREGAQRSVEEAWERSCGALIYLGEWHTHSQANPSPTEIDCVMIKRALAQAQMDIDFLLLLIVGQAGSFWVGWQTKRGLSELRPRGNRCQKHRHHSVR